jgi:hypothetical protein
VFGLTRAPGPPLTSAVAKPVTLVSERFDEIRCGTITLSVPLKDDVIQVGGRDAPGQGMIRVRRRRRTATVKRTDGKPLQVAIVHQPDTFTTAPARTLLTATHVFHRPVQTLRLKRRRNAARNTWGVKVTQANLLDPRHLKQFVDTIGTFGSAKQRLHARPREVCGSHWVALIRWVMIAISRC